MKVTRFDPTGDLIIVIGYLWGPGGREKRPLSLAIDTGSAETVITPDVVDELGYSPRDGEAITTVRAAIGKSTATRYEWRDSLHSASPLRTFVSTCSISPRAGASTA